VAKYRYESSIRQLQGIAGWAGWEPALQQLRLLVCRWCARLGSRPASNLWNWSSQLQRYLPYQSMQHLMNHQIVQLMQVKPVLGGCSWLPRCPAAGPARWRHISAIRTPALILSHDSLFFGASVNCYCARESPADTAKPFACHGALDRCPLQSSTLAAAMVKIIDGEIVPGEGSARREWRGALSRVQQASEIRERGLVHGCGPFLSSP